MRLTKASKESKASKISEAFDHVDCTLHYLMWCIRYPRLFSRLFFIGRGSWLDIGPRADVRFGHRVHFTANFTGEFYGKVTIGDRVFFNRNCYVAAREELTIG